MGEKMTLEIKQLAGNTTSPLHSFDAKVWADDFCAIAKTLGHDLDRDWMLGWFANALMRGWDEHKKRNQEKLDAFLPGGAVERLVEWAKKHTGRSIEDYPANTAIKELEALLPKPGQEGG